MNLVGGDLSGKALASLRPITKLERLGLTDSAFGDADCRWLSQLAHLRVLDLSRSKITDAGLKSIAKLPHLDTLLIDGTKVTKSGLASLDGNESLQIVFARHTLAGETDFTGGAPNLVHTTFYILSDKPDADDDAAESEDEAAQ